MSRELVAVVEQVLQLGLARRFAVLAEPSYSTVAVEEDGLGKIPDAVALCARAFIYRNGQRIAAFGDEGVHIIGSLRTVDGDDDEALVFVFFCITRHSGRVARRIRATKWPKNAAPPLCL